MRVTVGTIAVLGLAVSIAAAQPPRERAAELKPPQALTPGELPIARGAIDDFPATSLPSTPVTRSKAPAVASGPAWLTGGDANVRPASGLSTRAGGVRTLTLPTSVTKDEPPAQPKIIDRIKNAVIGEKQAPPQPLPQPVMQTQQPQQQPTASTPFRGTGANGAPVYAGPPAYRWYGWGTVTPGANPLAPTGQYPKASANWYNITGATPGAFPVPVGNPVHMPAGTEPPSYGLAARTPSAATPVVPISSVPPPTPAIPFTERTTPPVKSADSRPRPAPGVSTGTLPPALIPPAPAPVSVPVITPPPQPKPAAVAPPALPPLPAPKPEPMPDSTAKLPPLPAPAAPPAPAPTVTAAEPVKLPVPVIDRKTTGAPGPLPTSVMTNPPRQDVQWQQSKEPTTPAPGTWAPAPGAAPLPTMPTGDAGVPVGRAPASPVVARGQIGDQKPDPIATLIKQVCQGRAEGVEIRWTGTKKLSVCFEVRTATDAKRLVDDISRRPELTAYQIDFCVFVK